ncbi:MAG TPA: UDP-N-acetylglucosamine 2-epimerase (non-hydrolyzing) [Candidatus Babeliales bacterium]|nr:UDP-N-acetylglucosamine 2-epimerase (non-hydrolyzing) [Candidatus Babeliales bacterium]
MNPILLVIGTRPEGIKMIPLYFQLKKALMPVILCATNQHTDLLQEVFDIFQVKPDVELSIMRPGQDLFHITTETLEKIKPVFEKFQPSWVVVMGDTTTAMAASLAAFYCQIPVAHVEAGLRTSTIYAPYPEELNRRIISTITGLHFAPTSLAVGNLLAERADRRAVVHTGNTVVDALFMLKEKIINGAIEVDQQLKMAVEQKDIKYRQLVLVTAHRRESFNGGIANILRAVKNAALENPDILFFYPYHPNPNVLKAIEQEGITNIHNIYLCKPLSYKNLVYLLLNVDWVATDSGGICEEAVSLGKKVLILREETERMEAVWAGLATLIGTQYENIFEAIKKMISQAHNSSTMQTIYGDGHAAEKMVSALENFAPQGGKNQSMHVLAHTQI